LRLKDTEVVVNVQGDEPLIAPKLISRVARALAKDAPMSTACHAIHDEASLANPNVVKVVLDRRGYALYFSRSQIPFPRVGTPLAYRHAGIYGYRVSFLKKYAGLKPPEVEKAEALEQLRVLWHGYRIAVVVSETEIPPGVDTPQDLEAVRRMLS
jgi:3-deoxy-manno-octulosonate cytidylyltransferase (CMP-KDO synthetase)